MAKDVDKELKDILDNYSSEVNEKINNIIKEESKDSVKRLKNSTPFMRTGKYKKSWGVKVKTSGMKATATIHNREKYMLTHLLEKPRRKVNKRGQFKGMTSGKPHIKPEEERVVKEVERRIKEEIKGGN